MEEGWVPKEIPFTATPGPRGAAADIQSDDPVDFVELYLTDELLLSIPDKCVRIWLGASHLGNCHYSLEPI